MSPSQSPLTAVLGTHRRAFLLSIGIGAVLMLGVRSMLYEPDGSMTMAAANPAAEHHAAPGHEGHAHDGSVSEAAAAAAEPADDDGPGGHGKKSDEKAGDGAGEHAGHDADNGSDHKGHDADGKSDGDEAKHVSVLLDLGNADCPVMKGEVNGETFSEWNGLRVGHCCPGCGGRFLKNPESLLDDVSPKWRDAAAAAKAINAEDGKARKDLIAKAAKTWTVVREPVGVAPEETSGMLVDVGNTACPVMGGDVNGKTFTEWNGLRVGHCCPGCTKRFLANPEALLDEVAPKWREAAAAVKSVEDSAGKAREKALTALRKTWTVVREPKSADAE